MSKLARIIVDISSTNLNQGYDYFIPPKLEKENLKIGQVVTVPFGRRNVRGFIIGFPEKTNISKNKIKSIKKINKKESFFNSTMLNLFKWMADYYQVPLASIIKTALPTGVLKGKINKKTHKYVVPAQSIAKTRNIIDKIKKRAPKQARALKVLLENKNKKFNIKLLAKKAECYRGAVKKLQEKGYIKIQKETTKRRPGIDINYKKNIDFKLTPEQKHAVKEVDKYLQKNNFQTFLLHGVTGSGKTEVYLRLIEKTIKKNQGSIILVPEIALAPVMVRRIYNRFGDNLAILHSNLSLGERYDEWRRLNNGEALIAIGARSAIFAPVSNTSLIIIDEEHENSYKQNSSPYYHARMVARKRARLENAPLILGSATPSLNSYYLAQKNKYHYLSLPRRIKSHSMPPVKIVDMRKELKKGNTSIFSQELYNYVKKALKNEKQVLLFLNRRGYSSFVLCRECGKVITCNNCDISLTYHAEENLLKCHYCDYTQTVPDTCPDCGSQYIRKFGIGTEKIEGETKKIFPEARVERMDIDTTSRKGAHQRILSRVEKGKTDILVGTQMIAKGHDYPNIAVVGVITADTMLNLPDFRSAERTFQLLTQVAGRTGRGQNKGKVIIQTYSPQHYSIQAAKNHDYHNFYQKEIKLRKSLEYPPFSILANIIISGENNNKVMELAQECGQFLDNYHEYIDEVLGPSPAPLEKLRGKYRWQLILKFNKYNKRKKVLQAINSKFRPINSDKINFVIDVDPQTML